MVLTKIRTNPFPGLSREIFPKQTPKKYHPPPLLNIFRENGEHACGPLVHGGGGGAENKHRYNPDSGHGGGDRLSSFKWT